MVYLNLIIRRERTVNDIRVSMPQSADGLFEPWSIQRQANHTASFNASIGGWFI